MSEQGSKEAGLRRLKTRRWPIGLALVAVAIAIAETRTFSWPARVSVATVELGAAALLGWSWRRGRREEGGALSPSRLVAWGVLVAAGVAWELDELFRSPRVAYPTASSLLGDAMAATVWAKAAIVLAWLVLGMVLVW